MALDPYSPCPCGSGKKLKFCCSDLAPEIEKIHRMIEGDQPRAALSHLNHLLSKRPDRFSLLDLKATLEISLGEQGEVVQTLKTLVSSHGNQPSVHAHLAILATLTEGGLTEEGRAAVGHLQDAMDRLDKTIPSRVLEAITAVGHALLVDGDLIAARAHLLMAVGFSGNEDPHALEMLLRINMQTDLPLLLRDGPFLAEPPSNVPWGPSMEEANKLAGRGLWKQAEKRFVGLLNDTSPQPEVLFNLALIRGWLGQKEAFASGLRQFARLDVPLDDAVEAEALAQLVAPDDEEPTIETVRQVYPIRDTDALAEKFAIDPRVDLCPPHPESPDDDKLDRPRSEHFLLDRPLPTSGIDLERSEVPNVVAFLAIHGKRTDREARLEVTTDRQDRYEQTCKILNELAGDFLGEDFPGNPLEEEVVNREPLGEDALRWRWRLPEDTPESQRRLLLKSQRWHAILNRWTTAPRAILGGVTPEEAANDRDLRIPLLASLLHVELAITDPEEQALIQALRERLQLPPVEPIDPEGVNVDRFPLGRVPRLKIEQMTDGQLARLLDRGSMAGAHLTVLTVGEELVGRKEPSDSVDIATTYRRLIHMSPTPEQALDRIAAARAWAKQMDQSEASWAVLQLQVHLKAHDASGAKRVLDEIQDHHLEQPGISEAVDRILQLAGLLPPDGSPPTEHAVAGSQPAHGVPTPPIASTAIGAPHQKIWTPNDGGGASGAAPPDTAKPAIWTPS